jgi:hypothetical protein
MPELYSSSSCLQRLEKSVQNNVLVSGSLVQEVIFRSNESYKDALLPHVTVRQNTALFRHLHTVHWLMSDCRRARRKESKAEADLLFHRLRKYPLQLHFLQREKVSIRGTYIYLRTEGRSLAEP